eukprot:1124758-Rhodomonas_salina.1
MVYRRHAAAAAHPHHPHPHQHGHARHEHHDHDHDHDHQHCRYHHHRQQQQLAPDDALADVDARVLLPLGVPDPELGHDRDRVQPCVLRQRRRDDLQRLGKRAHAVALDTRQLLGILHQLGRDLHFGRGAARDHVALLEEGAHDAERVVDGALVLLEHQLVRAPTQDRHRPARLRHPARLTPEHVSALCPAAHYAWGMRACSVKHSDMPGSERAKAGSTPYTPHASVQHPECTPMSSVP